MLTNKALDAAEGEEGTVKNETLKRTKPAVPRTFPTLCTAVSFRNCKPTDKNTKPRGAHNKSATRRSYTMRLLHCIRLINMAAVGSVQWHFHRLSNDDSNKYPSMVAKLFR